MAANTTRSCKKCGATHELTEGFFRQVLGRDKSTKYFKRVCRDCERIASRKYQRTHPEIVKRNNQKLSVKNPNYVKKWKEDNKDQQREYRREYEGRINVKLKKRVSRAIHHALSKKGFSKPIDTLSFLPYTMEDLKLHIESKFEPWMHWGNWGRYDPKSWNDSNPETWTWQLDHIKPMANHTYSCQKDAGFLEAWKLENLRPLKAKDNIILGAKMKRVSTINEVQYGG